ncbi:MAG TPA: hypothetical protein DSN98_03115 [Thermoplasmata archaeon]|nr:MAG TPA: hypothetical protein DSN98_03115 [Thermoplasmata archaeon]
MKSKRKKPLTQKPKAPKKKADKEATCAKVQKIAVGVDEFCPTCMEWRAFDELTGKCLVCGRLIKKIGDTKKITDEYDLKDFANEHDEPQETGEF